MIRMRRRGLLWREEQKKQACEDKLKLIEQLKCNDKWALLEQRLKAARRAEAQERNNMLKKRRASTSQLPDSSHLDGRCRMKVKMRPTLSAAEEDEAFDGYASALYIFMWAMLVLLVLLVISTLYQFCMVVDLNWTNK
ncbi:uncharacterized protein LOC125179000 [Hyalella azteca]|uniref:Uncharacterized protein LOC125179000 n=1 Tax=Hyalella azteca TaxID=294128 RepID=A0A979FS31_HYAAZ|nr:uncharacterized protein LOC125179000 [Hyalella azteca]